MKALYNLYNIPLCYGISLHVCRSSPMFKKKKNLNLLQTQKKAQIYMLNSKGCFGLCVILQTSSVAVYV